MPTVTPTVQDALTQIATSAAQGVSAYVNAVAVREIARVSAPPQQQVLAGMSQPVIIAGQSVSPWVLLIGAVVVIGGAVMVLKK